MHRNPARPLSPHLTIWRWGPHMAVSILNRVTGVGLTWALVFHTFGGVRHYVLDIGAGHELTTNKRWSWITIGMSFVVTAAIWAYIVGVK